MFAEARRDRVSDADLFHVAQQETGITETRGKAAKSGPVEVRKTSLVRSEGITAGGVRLDISRVAFEARFAAKFESVIALDPGQAGVGRLFLSDIVGVVRAADILHAALTCAGIGRGR